MRTGKGSGDNEMGYVERTLGFRTRDLDHRDLCLVTDVGGTIRWRRYLDHLISSLCHDESMFGNMEPLLKQYILILRIGCYEIVKLDMPPYAVVDENVRLAKVALQPGAGSMVNRIFRKLVGVKDSNSLPLPNVEGDDRTQARALAILHSHPLALDKVFWSRRSNSANDVEQHRTHFQLESKQRQRRYKRQPSDAA